MNCQKAYRFKSQAGHFVEPICRTCNDQQKKLTFSFHVKMRMYDHEDDKGLKREEEEGKGVEDGEEDKRRGKKKWRRKREEEKKIQKKKKK